MRVCLFWFNFYFMSLNLCFFVFWFYIFDELWCLGFSGVLYLLM